MYNTYRSARIRELGPGCELYQIDLSRAHRQLSSDSRDWPFLGIDWQEGSYIDTSIPFGLRHGASACQRVSEAVTEIAHHDVQATAYAYVDDTVGAALPSHSREQYCCVLGTMSSLGLVSAPHKALPPPLVSHG